ncbi:MAG: lipase maturation factor family protein [Waddliaceae bacterium]
MFSPESSLIITTVFPRLLGMIYLFALGAFLFQILGLVGSEGILPAKKYLEFFKQRLGKRRFYWIPTVFWCNAGDRALMGTIVLGVVFAVLLVAGVYPPVMLFLLIVIHLSIVSIGQDFLSFGWEMFFLEIAYHAFFLSLASPPNIFIWISINLLIIRFHWQAGISKLKSGEPTWKNLTALHYHYETQPLPNTVAWFFHQLPGWFHQCSVLMMFAIELFVPFGVLGTEFIRLQAFALFFLLQLFIWISGNYSYLNHLTVVLVALLISDTYLAFLFGQPEPLVASSWPLQLFLSAVGITFIVFHIMQLWNQLFSSPRVNRILRAATPFHFTNRYGIFAVMTTTRYEIVVEGSRDNHTWKEYLFRCKPSEVDRRPRRISPYQPRLDWQAWFLPFTSWENAPWFQNFLICLLKGSPHVLFLLRHNPFPDEPPAYIRAKMYVYRFSDPITKRRLGHWWVREYLREYTHSNSRIGFEQRESSRD